MAARLSSALLRTQADRRLTTLAAGGSEPAFEALVDRYRRPLQAYCRRLLLDGATAEDVVQQAFLSTWQALRGGAEIDDVKPWLFRVVHNGAVNALRRSGYRHEELDEALSGSGAPDEDLERRIAVRRTLAGLAALPELQREALLRTAVEGRSHEEVARELGISDGAVRGLVYRARVTLRAGATALTPAPVAAWIAAAGGRTGSTMAERVGELVAGGGSAGALLLKGGATVAATGVLAGGAVIVRSEGVGERRAVAGAATTPGSTSPAPPRAPAAVRATRPLRRAAITTAPTRPGVAASPRSDVRDRRGERDSRAGSGDGDDVDEDRSGPSEDAPAVERDRSGRRDGEEHSSLSGGDDVDEDRSGPSGDGGEDDDRVERDSWSSGSETSGSDDGMTADSGELDDDAPEADPEERSGSDADSSGRDDDADDLLDGP